MVIYVPPELHRAMKWRGVEEGRPGSDLYVEAAHAYLAARAMPPSSVAPTSDPSGTMSSTVEELARAVRDQGERIEALHGKIDLGRSIRNDEDGPARTAGTKAAVVMRAMLGVLGRAGEAGMDTHDLRRAMSNEGITSGATETARAVMRAAGIVTAEDGRWFVRRP